MSVTIDIGERLVAQRLFFSPTFVPGTGWDSAATFSSTRGNALSYDDFVVGLVQGATYDLLSSSAFDPIFFRIQDNTGRLLASDQGGGTYGTDVIRDFVAPYTGDYYVSASWDQGAFASYVSLSIYADFDTISRSMAVNRGGFATREVATTYFGPVSYLQLQFLGTSQSEAVIGTASNDFFNLGAGDDAAQGGAGSDVLDGGTGSNFLSGGSGLDVFFLDGRGGRASWATITDYAPGEEVVIWGWRPGISRSTVVEGDGAAGYRGVTLHADLDGNGTIDTSITATGYTAAQIPTPLEFDGLLWFQ